MKSDSASSLAIHGSQLQSLLALWHGNQGTAHNGRSFAEPEEEKTRV